MFHVFSLFVLFSKKIDHIKFKVWTKHQNTLPDTKRIIERFTLSEIIILFPFEIGEYCFSFGPERVYNAMSCNSDNIFRRFAVDRFPLHFCLLYLDGEFFTHRLKMSNIFVHRRENGEEIALIIMGKKHCTVTLRVPYCQWPRSILKSKHLLKQVRLRAKHDVTRFRSSVFPK